MSESDQLLDVLESLLKVVPEWSRKRFLHVRSKIAYTAPELIGLRWCNIHEILVDISAADESGAWVEEARTIWNTAYEQRSEQTKVVTDAVLGPRIVDSFPQTRR